MHPFLNSLVQNINTYAEKLSDPADLVDAYAPLMSEHIHQSSDTILNEFIETLRWPEPEDTMYSRQRVAEAEDQSWSLYAITWCPGQYTPIHDHGTWGAVTVLTGHLHEHQMQRIDEGNDEAIELVRAGICILSPGAVNTFTAYPDHIHYTGIPANAAPTASLHLYGKLMTRYYAYDLSTGTRYPLDVE
jgi:3-mercaptopropionate dioxygenase